MAAPSRDWLEASIRRWQARLKAAQKAAARAQAQIRLRRQQLAARPRAWNPAAKRAPYADSGAWRIKAPARLVWHTTEGTSLPRYGPGTAPHFTLDPLTGDLWQHIRVDRAALSLEHPPGAVETNHAHAIQVELVAFSDTARAKALGHPERAVVNLTAAHYARMAELARWIEANAGVRRKCTVTFAGRGRAKRMGPDEWLKYDGHCGHEHVPAQPSGHWDPARLRIDRII